MTKPSPQTTNPLDRLQTLATTEAERRESARAANRARFPQLAEAADVWGAKLEWAQDADGEIGRKQPLPANEFVISAEIYDALREHAAYQAKGRRK